MFEIDKQWKCSNYNIFNYLVCQSNQFIRCIFIMIKFKKQLNTYLYNIISIQWLYVINTYNSNRNT